MNDDRADVGEWPGLLRSGSPVLVTGAAGFIGFHFCRRLLAEGVRVVGFDNMTPYYDPALKSARRALLEADPGFVMIEADLADPAAVADVVAAWRPTHVVHLAAQAGVRYSIENPFAYADSNLTGFLSVLEACRGGGVSHLVYASSSSVYGGNTQLPFSTADSVDHPVSLYAATKKAGELMAHSYSHLHGIPATGLRFFTVYGPWGRPDMAYWKFAEAISDGRPIDVYNHGDMGRDFTYVDDVVEAMARLLPLPPAVDPGFDRARPAPGRSWAPHRVLNIGADRPERLTDLIDALEREIGRPATRRMLPMQPGDVKETWADIEDLAALVGFRPQVGLAEGMARFAAWFTEWRVVSASSSLQA
jgi:UDP-glucuronate 4-epimerase